MTARNGRSDAVHGAGPVVSPLDEGKIIPDSMLIIRSSRAVQGYFGAFAVATPAFAVRRNMASLLVDSLCPFRLDHLLILLAAVSIIAAVIWIVAHGPWLFVVRLAKRAGIRNPLYYASWGAATGLVLGRPVFALWPGFMTDSEAQPWLWADRFVVDLLNVGPTFALSGAIGGVAYWCINGRHTAARLIYERATT